MKTKLKQLVTNRKIYIPIILLVLLGACWSCIPMQIKGTPQDDFRAFVIDPIPDSVENLEVADNDLIVIPDRTYCFRFNILPEDIETIIDVRQLELTEEDIMGIQTSLIDIDEWEAEAADTIFDYYEYEYRDSSDILQEFDQLWFDKLNNQAIYCYSSL